MTLFAMAMRSGVFAQGRFLGKILDEWIGDAQEFVHTKLPHLVMLIVIAVLLTRLIVMITKRVVRIAGKHDARPGRNSQVKTFASILQTTLTGIVWGLTALQVLEVIGINLGPLLATAGIAGVAIGLAAQTIVKDMLNGMLVLMEDQYNVGDVVRITGMTGTVETMTLRRTEVRDGDGTLYIVPNSQITTVANLSRDFSVATVNVSVDFSADPAKVIPLLTKIAKDIRNDDAFKKVFLADPEVLGVDSLVGSQVIYPVVFKTIALQQYGAIREFRRRVRIALDQNGMLPGDPNRVFQGKGAAGAALPGGKPEEGAKAVDPTTIPSHTINPLTGE
jgi:moderate conductance mechanosensitive channel